MLPEGERKQLKGFQLGSFVFVHASAPGYESVCTCVWGRAPSALLLRETLGP